MIDFFLLGCKKGWGDYQLNGHILKKGTHIIIIFVKVIFEKVIRLPETSKSVWPRKLLVSPHSGQSTIEEDQNLIEEEHEDTEECQLIRCSRRQKQNAERDANQQSFINFKTMSAEDLDKLAPDEVILLISNI
ncbi:hypothetical protein Pint_22723 [Pistacia integerrima]|uniref:Uncharacterized protein n=1 Tax=Pistacia integerrima TaxID=434235 RepID=A0ACC0YQI4_9ROSI|nr:hypothetical protein Pint_22723 [Pistacia integerrima]